MGAYERFFRLHDEPFRLTPDPRYLFLSDKHREVLAHLRLGTSESAGFVCITGDVGTGKTTLIRSFLDQLEPGTPHAYLFNPPQSPLELLQTINAEFQLPSTHPSRKALVDALNAFLLAQRRAGHRPLVVVDEAQALAPEVLEELRLLSNLETTTAKLLQIVLFGQPQLADVLSSADLAQLNQRITLRWHLGPLNAQETVAYVHHRLRVAAGGIDRTLFTRRALRRIHLYSSGVPRLINIFCHRCLLAAYAAERRRVTLRVVEQVHDEIQRIPLLGSRRLAASRRRRAVWAAGGLTAVAAVAWVLVSTGRLPLDLQISSFTRARPELLAAPARHIADSEPPLQLVQSDTAAQPPTPAPPDTTAQPDTAARTDTTAQLPTPAPPDATARPDTAARTDTAAQPPAPAPPATTAQPATTGQPGIMVAETAVTSTTQPRGDVEPRGEHLAADSEGKPLEPAVPEKTAPVTADEVARMLVANSETASTVAAIAAVLERWGERPLSPREKIIPMDLAAIAARRDLRHLPVSGTVNMLRILNLPAILELVLPGAAGPRYALLVGVDATTCRLVLDSSTVIADRAFLDAHWLGQAHIMWRDFEDLAPIIRKRSVGARVRRLQQMLTQLAFYTGPITGVFDDRTEIAVVAFQRSRRLFADALVGQLTRIALYDALGTYDHPRLVTDESNDAGADT